MKANDIKWAPEQRLQFIEYRAFWYGGLNRADLISQFGISVPQASKDLMAYQELAPGNLTYDRSHKRYHIASSFQPRFITCDPDEFLQNLLTDNAAQISKSDQLSVSRTCEALPLPKRQIGANVLRSIAACQQNGLAIEILYQSMSALRPGAEWRQITPHSFASDGLRWHVRAFCHLDQKYKDFILSRCLDTRAAGEAGTQPEADRMWHESFTVELAPNPLLSKGQQKIIEADFGMKNGRTQISVRKAMLYYFSKRLRLDVAQIADSPGEAPVVIANKAAFDEALREATR